MTDTRYNGWTNYETWAVNLWLSNEQSSADYWADAARDAVDAAPDCKQVLAEIWKSEQAARYSLANRLESEISESSPISGSSLYADLMGAALQEVNWAEIAQHMIDDLS